MDSLRSLYNPHWSFLALLPEAIHYVDNISLCEEYDSVPAHYQLLDFILERFDHQSFRPPIFKRLELSEELRGILIGEAVDELFSLF